MTYYCSNTLRYAYDVPREKNMVNITGRRNGLKAEPYHIKVCDKTI